MTSSDRISLNMTQEIIELLSELGYPYGSIEELELDLSKRGKQLEEATSKNQNGLAKMLRNPLEKLLMDIEGKSWLIWLTIAVFFSNKFHPQSQFFLFLLKFSF